MRIVSLLPSTTEIVAALGKANQLVGRSHECNYPKGIEKLPSCTEPKFNPDGNSYEIDQRVKTLLQEGLSVYRVNAEKLKSLEPDIILTQDHCEVCAASVDEVKQAVRSRLGEHIRVVSVSPTNLSSVIDSIRLIAEAIDADEAGESLLANMKSRMSQIQQKTTELSRPDVLGIEWIDPLMTAGNWVPELMQLTGGNPLGATAGEHSPLIDWEQICDYNPEIITVMPCGYSVQQSLSEISALTSQKNWGNLRAVRNRQVFILDGDQYFNRPGPRLVESTQILAEIFHPSIFRKSRQQQTGWINLWRHQFHQQIGAYD